MTTQRLNTPIAKTTDPFLNMVFWAADLLKSYDVVTVTTAVRGHGLDWFEVKRVVYAALTGINPTEVITERN